MLKVLASTYIAKSEPGYNFNTTGKPDHFKTQKFSAELGRYLYYYETHSGHIVISYSMDCTAMNRFIFGMEVRKLKNEYEFVFEDMEDIIRRNEEGSVSKTRLAKRLSGRETEEERLLRQKLIQSRLMEQRPLQYFFPVNDSRQIWFVPRYTYKLQVNQGEVLRVYRTKTYEEKRTAKDVLIKKIYLKNSLMPVDVSEIENDPQLPMKNQKNLLHVSHKWPDEDAICWICMSKYEKDAASSDYLISVCDCKSGQEFLHMSCLFKCISAKPDKLECSICKRPFPQYIELNIPGQGQTQRIYFKLLHDSKKSASQIFIGSVNIKMINNELRIQSHQQESGCYCVEDIAIKSFGRLYLDEGSGKFCAEDSMTDYGLLIKKKDKRFRMDKRSMSTCAILVDRTLFYFKVEQTQ